MTEKITGIFGESVEQLITRAHGIAASHDGRIGAVGNCLMCGESTSGGEDNLCNAARAYRDCKAERALAYAPGNQYKEIPASPALKKAIQKLEKILGGSEKVNKRRYRRHGKA